ncbi:MAG: magnesium/cobalt transporter CorA [Deltaproteobacteria bacterium]|nr:magnesium/cobalt transporter CorA [Deltaproteobacteria bacterium]
MRTEAKKLGLPPGALVHIGYPKEEETRVSVLSYDEAGLKETLDVSPCDIPGLIATDRVTWVRVEGVHDVDVVEQIGAIFKLHPLVMEDIVNTLHRPKIEDYEGRLFLVLKMLFFDRKQAQLQSEQISLVLGDGWLISFHEGPHDLLSTVAERIASGRGRIRKQKADYLAYALLDCVVDHYFQTIEDIDEVVEQIEEQVLFGPQLKTLARLQRLKRADLVLRKSVWPLREVIGSLTRGEFALIAETTVPYLRDVYDHTIHIIDAAESLRDILSGLLDIYLSSVGNRLNQVMKFLAMITTIFMPLGLLAGIYGMNFKYMPELQWHWGYPAVLIVMVVAALTMVILFRRKGWF